MRVDHRAQSFRFRGGGFDKLSLSGNGERVGVMLGLVGRVVGQARRSLPLQLSRCQGERAWVAPQAIRLHHVDGIGVVRDANLEGAGKSFPCRVAGGASPAGGKNLRPNPPPQPASAGR